MNRNQLIKTTGQMIDELRPIVYRVNSPKGYAILGELEIFANDLTSIPGLRLMNEKNYLTYTVRGAELELCRLKRVVKDFKLTEDERV